MKLLSSIFSVLLASALVVAIGAGVYKGFQTIKVIFTGLHPQVANVIYAVLIALVLGAFLISMIARRVRRQNSLDQMLLEKKEVYRRFVEAWSAVLSQHSAEEMQSMKMRLWVVEKQLLFLGSSNVIKHYVAYQKLEVQTDSNKEDLISHIEKVLLEMRKDSGQSNVSINKGDLVGMMLHNFPESEYNHKPTLQTGKAERQPAYK